MFGQIESCKTCHGTGVVEIEIFEQKRPVQPTEIVRRARRLPKGEPGRLSYETVIKLSVTIDKIMNALVNMGFDQALVENLDDVSTADSLRGAFQLMIEEEISRRQASNEAKMSGGSPPPPSELLRLARLFRDLRAVRKEIGVSTIN